MKVYIITRDGEVVGVWGTRENATKCMDEFLKGDSGDDFSFEEHEVDFCEHLDDLNREWENIVRVFNAGKGKAH